jgi:hypothetical protein
MEKIHFVTKGVFSGFTSINVALIFLAYKGKVLAGDTPKEAPTIIMASQLIE